MKNIWIKNSYFFTISFFVLGFFNIAFAWLGFICLFAPLIFVVKDKNKTWCKSYCPRSNFLNKVFSKISLKLTFPKFLVNGAAKKTMLIYFSINFFMIVMSTIMVFLDNREPLDKIRFLIAFQLPWDIPQLLQVSFLSDWTLHLSYRVYSMMFTTTILGLILGLLFRPRTWCTICPMGTLTGMTVKKQKINLNPSLSTGK